MGDVEDAVPPEWTRMQEEKAALAESWRQDRRQHRNNILTFAIPIGLVAAVFVTLGILSISPSPQPTTTPSEVTAFAAALPAAQEPNSTGVTVVDNTYAPQTWRVAWETVNAAFCFAFVHSGKPAQVLCDAPGSMTSEKMQIGGELTDDGLTPTDLVTCGYTTGTAQVVGYVQLDAGRVVGVPVDMGSSGLSAFCLQLPDDTPPGASFSVTVAVLDEHDASKWVIKDVTATYP